jgi:hypothetical protein
MQPTICDIVTCELAAVQGVVRQGKRQSDAQLSVEIRAIQLSLAAASGNASRNIIHNIILDATFKKKGTH